MSELITFEEYTAGRTTALKEQIDRIVVDLCKKHRCSVDGIVKEVNEHIEKRMREADVDDQKLTLSFTLPPFYSLAGFFCVLCKLTLECGFSVLFKHGGATSLNIFFRSDLDDVRFDDEYTTARISCFVGSFMCHHMRLFRLVRVAQVLGFDSQVVKK